MVDENKLPEIDKWALARLNKLAKEVNEAYKAYRFHDVYHAVSNFCTIELSKMYIDIVKDRAYASARDDFGRRCAQTTMYKILSAMTRLISPILAFTADEIWKTMAHVQGDDVRNVLLNDMPMYDAAEPFAAEEAKYEKLFELRDTVLFALEGARASKLIGKSLEAKVVITADGETYDFLDGFDRDELSDVFIVSGTELVKGATQGDEKISVQVAKADGNKCARCWKHSTEAIEVDGEYICPRCKAILAF
jgi:isoleucyl-tRNA synthetase